MYMLAHDVRSPTGFSLLQQGKKGSRSINKLNMCKTILDWNKHFPHIEMEYDIAFAPEDIILYVLIYKSHIQSPQNKKTTHPLDQITLRVPLNNQTNGYIILLVFSSINKFVFNCHSAAIYIHLPTSVAIIFMPSFIRLTIYYIIILHPQNWMIGQYITPFTTKSPAGL